MRITAGHCRGRTITAPEGLEVRPTASKIRQAFFNILSNIVPDARFVDVCAGSGLMGFEALSRGAASLIAVEESKRFAQAISENASRLGFSDRVEVITGDARRVLPVLAPREADIIFVDPPYKTNLAQILADLIDKQDLLSEHGVAAIEHAGDVRLPEQLEQIYQYDRRKYGQTAITFYRRLGNKTEEEE